MLLSSFVFSSNFFILLRLLFYNIFSILINLTPLASRSIFETSEGMSKEDSSPDSIEDQYPWMNSEPSPFSSQPNMYNENEEVGVYFGCQNKELSK